MKTAERNKSACRSALVMTEVEVPGIWKKTDHIVTAKLTFIFGKETWK